MSSRKKLFDATYPDKGMDNISGIVAAEAVRGLAMGYDTSDNTKLVPATGTNFTGHLQRAVVSDGATLEERVFNNGMEYAYEMGGQCSVRDAVVIEAEGDDLLVTSGTGALSDSTSVGTALSFNDGKLRVAQAGDETFYRVAAADLTPQVSGNVRIRARRV